MLKIVEIAAEKVGGLVALANSLGIKHQALYGWRQVPADRVLAIEEITGVPREELRPDLAAIFVRSGHDGSKADNSEVSA